MFIKKVTKRNMESGAIYLTNNSLRSYRFENKPKYETIIYLGALSYQWGVP